MRRRNPALPASLMFVLACAPLPSTEPAEALVPPCDDVVDYHCDVAPLISQHCLSCHAQGGIAPLALDTYARAAEEAPAMAAAVSERLMPPWPPLESEDCPTFVGSRALSQEAIDTFLAWAAEGAPEGDPRQAPAVVQALEDEPLGEPDRVFSIGTGYQPNQSRQDDYRCFVVDPELTRQKWLHAYDVVPGNKAIVHHVLLYLVTENDVAELQRWEDEDPEVGFECFGTPSPGVPMTLGGWVPGQRPLRYRQGDGAWMPSNGRLVVQMHYNLISGAGIDETTVKLHFVDGQPYREVATLPLVAYDFDIPPGDPSYTYSENSGTLPEILFSDDLQLALEGVAPHMHTLGTAIDVTMDPPGGTPQCLVNVPKWDFHWQGFYLFDSLEPVPVPRNSTFTLSCTWDNSERNQLVVDGERLTPRWVDWGEGTRDEMCLAYLIISGTPGWTQLLLSAVEGQWD